MTDRLPAATAEPRPLTPEQLRTWHDDGYVIMPRLFEAEQIAAVRDFFDRLGQAGEPIPNHWETEPGSDDPLKRWPRVMQAHLMHDLPKQIMLAPAVHRVLRELFAEEAVACQCMYYYKPPHAAGQSLHQDNFYLAVQPGTCIAAWTAVDPADPGNGGMYVVPGSHRLDIICPDPGQIRDKRATNLVNPPKGMKAVPVEMQPGDTLFFNGSLIHGSGKNRSDTRWRRSFISHYMPASSTHVNPGYFPIFDFAGNEISYEAAQAGGPCGEAVAEYGATYGVDALIH